MVGRMRRGAILLALVSVLVVVAIPAAPAEAAKCRKIDSGRAGSYYVVKIRTKHVRCRTARRYIKFWLRYGGPEGRAAFHVGWQCFGNWGASRRRCRSGRKRIRFTVRKHPSAPTPPSYTPGGCCISPYYPGSF